MPFETELRVINKLHLKGKNLPIDIAITEVFTQDLVSSIIRNPNALMCMAKIREKDTYLLSHILNVAILLSKFGLILILKRTMTIIGAGRFFYDLGRVKIPDEILHKAGRLTNNK